MKGPLYISDDGKKEGTQEDVKAYEAALNPLAKFRFPWAAGWVNADRQSAVQELGVALGCGISDAAKRTIALLNLMPLVEELRQATTQEYPKWRGHQYLSYEHRLRANQQLLLAYEKALGIEQPS